MSGRLSALWNVVWFIPYIAGAFTSGYISGHLQPRLTFSLVGLLTVLIGVIGIWKPRAVFNGTYNKPQAKGTTFLGDIRRLARHRAIYPAVLIMFMWSFAPAAQTPLQFYLTNVLHASDAVYSYYTGIWIASFIPTIFIFGVLCKRVPLNKLLWWGTAFAVPQMIPLLFVHSANRALWLAVPIGLMGGVANAAYYDLAMRSCPPGMQGTLMMIEEGVLLLSQRGGDLLGARIYSSSPAHGFLYCTIATTIVYALMLPVLLWVPKELIATKDGERNPVVEAEVLEEVGESARGLGLA